MSCVQELSISLNCFILALSFIKHQLEGTRERARVSVSIRTFGQDIQSGPECALCTTLRFLLEGELVCVFIGQILCLCRNFVQPI